jgi:hypothetical protein
MKCTLTTINTRWEATQMVMAAKLTRLTHKISDTIAPSGRELYHLKFSLQTASPETFGYTHVFVFVLPLHCCLKHEKLKSERSVLLMT